MEHSFGSIVGHPDKTSLHRTISLGQGGGVGIESNLFLRFQPELGNPILKLLNFDFIFLGRQLDKRSGHPHTFGLLARTSAFGYLVKRVQHAVVIPGSNGVILMIMTLSAGHGQPQPGGGGHIYSVEQNHKALLLGNSPALSVVQMVAIEPAGYFLLRAGIWEKISCELPNGKLIKRHVIIESLNDPVSPNPLVGFSIKLKAIAVCIASGVQPFQSHSLAVMRTGQ